jgi:hydroxyethylthiazole kinase-like sugar kinase family protein
VTVAETTVSMGDTAIIRGNASEIVGLTSFVALPSFQTRRFVDRSSAERLYAKHRCEGATLAARKM